jgi:hypothetical protein
MHINWAPRLRLASIIIVAFAVSACAGRMATYAPDGRRGYAVSCTGLLSSWSSCLVKAGRACGNRGYDVIKGSEEDRALLIACKVPSVAASPPQPAH